MARIPIYTSQVSVRPSALPVATPGAFGPDVGGATADLSRPAERLGYQAQRLAEEQAERDAAVWSSQAVARAKTDWMERTLKAREAAPAGAAGFTPTLLGEYDSYVSQALENAPSERARAYLGDRLSDFRVTLAGQALEYEAASRVAKRYDDTAATLELNRNLVRSQPDQYGAVLADQLAAIDAAGLPAAEAEKLRTQTYQGLQRSAVQGAIDVDPQGALAELQEGRWDRLDADVKDALIGAAQSEIRRLEAEAERRRAEAHAVFRSDVERRYADAVVDVRVNGRSELVTRGELQAAYGDDAAGRLWRGLTDEADFYAVRQQVALTGPGNDQALLDQLRPEGENARAELERWQSLARAIDAKNQALAEDPAAYVLAASPAVQSAYAAADADPAKLGSALALAETVQRDLGVPKSLRRFLGGARADALVRDVLATPPAETADAMQGLAGRYGSHWPQVYGELVEAKLPDSFIVLATTDDPAARRMLAETMQAEAVKPGATKAVLADDAVTTINETVEEEMQDLRATLDYASDGVIVGARYDQAAKLLAYRMAATLPPAEAARQAVLAVATGGYEFTDTARAPAGQLDIVQGAADRLLARLKADELDDPGGAPELGLELRRSEYLERLRAEGIWVTNETDDGWVLYDPARRPALLKSGARVEFSFADALALPALPRAFGAKGGGVMP